MAKGKSRPALILACIAAIPVGRPMPVVAQPQPSADFIEKNAPAARANARKAFDTVFRICVESGLDHASVAAKAESLGWQRLNEVANVQEQEKGNPTAKQASWKFDVAPSDPNGTTMRFSLNHTTENGATKCTLSFSQTWDSSLAQVAILGFGRQPDDYSQDENSGSLKIGRVWHLVDQSGKGFSIRTSGPRHQMIDLDATRELVIETQR